MRVSNFACAFNSAQVGKLVSHSTRVGSGPLLCNSPRTMTRPVRKLSSHVYRDQDRVFGVRIPFVSSQVYLTDWAEQNRIKITNRIKLQVESTDIDIVDINQ